MKSRGDWRTVIAARRLWSKGVGWWEITLDCGHQAAVLHGVRSPLNERCECFFRSRVTQGPLRRSYTTPAAHGPLDGHRLSGWSMRRRDATARLSTPSCAGSTCRCGGRFASPMMMSMPDSWRVFTGECLDVLATLDPDSVDACVTDPPYGISFMGREWDTFKPHTVEAMRQRTVKDRRHVDNPNLHGRRAWTAGASVEYDRSAAASLKFQAWTQQWAEAVWRVLKPGAHAVVCASPRMGHRVTCGLEDAGFAIRDSLLWLHAVGFPKSLNLPGGLGTALKPAYEPIILARKPLGGRTVAQCVAEFGTARSTSLGAVSQRKADHMQPARPTSAAGRRTSRWTKRRRRCWMLKSAIERPEGPKIIAGDLMDICRVARARGETCPLAVRMSVAHHASSTARRRRATSASAAARICRNGRPARPPTARTEARA